MPAEASEHSPDVESGVPIQENAVYTRWGRWPSADALGYAHRQDWWGRRPVVVEWSRTDVGEQRVVPVGEMPVVVGVVVEGVALVVLLLGGTGRGGSCMPELAPQRPSDYQRQEEWVCMSSTEAK